ncbi:MAG: hypothetical protein KIS82_10215 [Ferruginibacter sp.]|nr:hypothetical protein [Bacteroidota bacterium]MCW5917708.1 hypothetical protein [Ferruginibacter sp.]
MEKISDYITRIKDRLQTLVKRYDDLKKNHSRQEIKIQKLESEKSELLNKIRILEEQQYLLKASAGKMNEADKVAFEKVLNGYIKQIDQCIQMLQQ